MIILSFIVTETISPETSSRTVKAHTLDRPGRHSNVYLFSGGTGKALLHTVFSH